jgi:hypothetical protein
MRARIVARSKIWPRARVYRSCQTYIGRAAETESHVHEALRLSPRDTRAHLWMMFVGAAKFAIPFSILLSIPGYVAPGVALSQPVAAECWHDGAQSRKCYLQSPVTDRAAVAPSRR